MLSLLDRVSGDGTVCKCISIAQYGHHNMRINLGTARTSILKFDFDQTVPDSGATSHMRRNYMDFEGDYVTCNNVFLLMSDNSEIPVLGYGTSRLLKINGHVVRLMNRLHVPYLDVDLFSYTRHGSNRKGNTFFLGDGKMNLTFHTFTLTDDIPKNEDLKVLIEPLIENDWGIPNFVCDGVPLQDEQLSNFTTRLSFLDSVLKGRIAGNDHTLTDQLFKGRIMTRAQQKEVYNKLQYALKCNFARKEDSNYGNEDDINNSNYGNEDDNNATNKEARKLNPIMNELPDHYLCEGFLDKMMMNAL